MEIRAVGAALLYADRCAERRMDGREDVTKTIGAFGNCANASTDYTLWYQISKDIGWVSQNTTL